MVMSSVATKKNYRVNINFTKEAYELLQELSQKRNKSVPDVIREAVSLENWFQTTQDEGGRILVDRDGELREIVRT